MPPTTIPSAGANSATMSDARAPWSSRDRISLSRGSVARGWSRLGGLDGAVRSMTSGSAIGRTAASEAEHATETVHSVAIAFVHLAPPGAPLPDGRPRSQSLRRRAPAAENAIEGRGRLRRNFWKCIHAGSRA
jgi:hypothetical protein